MPNPQRTVPVPQSRRQSGVVMMVILVLLIATSLLVAWTVRMVTFETKVAANQAFKDQTFQWVESAITGMEMCITGERRPSATLCRSGTTDLTANTPFNGSAAPGFLARASNNDRARSSYWAPGYVNDGGTPPSTHDWATTSQYTPIGAPGLSNTQQPRLTVERMNVTNLSGFSSDSASQGAALGSAIPFRITGTTWTGGNSSAVSTVQTFIYVPEAAVTTPE